MSVIDMLNVNAGALMMFEYSLHRKKNPTQYILGIRDLPMNTAGDIIRKLIKNSNQRYYY